MRQRWAIAGLGIVAALAFGATACTTGTGSASPTGSPQTGVQVLTLAAEKTKGQSYQFSVTYGTTLTGEGVASGDGSATSMKITFADAATGVVVKADALVLPTAAYAKIDMGPAAGALIGVPPTSWVHIDPAKAPGAARLGVTPGKDIFGPDNYLKAVTAAKVDGPTQISGTIDLAKTTLPGVAVAGIPASQQGLNFVATLDDQGRISKIVVKVPPIGETAPGADLTTVYSNWGTKVDATPPAANQTVEAPAILYTFLQ